MTSLAIQASLMGESSEDTVGEFIGRVVFGNFRWQVSTTAQAFPALRNISPTVSVNTQPPKPIIYFFQFPYLLTNDRQTQSFVRS
ncbi:MAG: hypothetical protein RMX59_004845 [Nostoc sp. DedSLP05]|nr:hypothetical protein [Nostoc sp. DedSLP05]MDZ8098178.1 hypothetical protein [Nostoc sp. DedSLP01]